METSRYLIKEKSEKNKTENTIINEIINQLLENKMSVLVGAGFSKNASVKFPGWFELLEKMIKEEVYKEEFEKWNFKNKKKKEKKKPSDFTWEIVQKEGYLEIVEKFINLKGMREAVTFYIEDHLYKAYDSEESLPLDLHKKLLSLPWNNVYTTNYDNLLEEASSEGEYDYQFVKKAEDLALGSNKRIIKLHGSLRTKQDIEENKFGFDNDLNIHYIITKSDYESYPEKHSAFTHLMRIALLQESFCLIGFSGDDPNFIKWVEWVRDILKKNNNQKVYLIDTSSNEISREKSLYFKNYGIKHIPLKELYKDKKNEKERVEKFIEDLSMPLKKEQEKIEINITNYEKLWGKINPTSNLNEILILEKDFVFPKSNIRKIAKDNLLKYRNKLLGEFKSNNKFQVLKAAEFLALHLRNSYIPLNKAYNQTEIKIIELSLEKVKDQLESKNDKKIWVCLGEYFLRYERSILNKVSFFKWMEAILELELDEMHNHLIYQKAIFYAVNLDFKKLENIVESWELKEEYSERWFYIKKAFLYLLINNGKTEDAIKFIKTSENLMKNKQDKMFINELLTYFNQGTSFSVDSRRIKEIKDYEALGCYKLENLITDLKIKDDEEKIIKRYKTQGTIIGESKEERDYFNSLFLSEIVFEIGLPLKVGHIVWLGEKQWKKLFKNIIKNDLNTGVLFSLFYGGNSSDEEFIKELFKIISSDPEISYENKLKVLNGLINIWEYFYEKAIINRKILFAISELIKVIEYSKWQKFFNKLWKEIDTNKNLKKLIYSKMWGLGAPFTEVLQFVQDEELIKEILIDNLIIEIDKSDSISLNIPLNNIYNLLYKNEKNNIEKLDKKTLENILQRYSEKTQFNDDDIIKIYYLRNFFEKETIKNICKKVEFSKIYNKNLVLEMALYEREVVNNLKKFIFSNINNIFYNGIKNGIKGSGSNGIKVSNFIENDKINLEIEDILKIYNRLKISLDELLKYYEKIGDFHLLKGEDIPLLRDMRTFLKNQEEILRNNTETKEFESILNLVENLYEEQTGFSSIVEGLSSSNPDVLLHSINELYLNLKESPKIKKDIEWQVFLSRILLKNKIRLEESFDVFISVLYNLKSLPEMKNSWLYKYKDNYIEVLKNYKNWYESEVDMCLIEKTLIKIAYILKNDFEIKDEIIEFWIKRKSTTLFQEIKIMNIC